MNTKKKIIICLIIFGLIIISVSIFKYKKYLEIKKEFSIHAKYIISSISKIEDLREIEMVFYQYDKALDEVNITYSREMFNDIRDKINVLDSSIFKDSLIDKMSKLETLLKEYERKKALVVNNPDKSVGTTMEKENVKSIETISGKITAFTPFCGGGCNGYTASGKYVGNNIFYEDKEYGIVRIVAGDSSYPFGTIVRFNNMSYFGEDVYAIVLDRGSAIGKNKWALFDLLFTSESSANDFGVQMNVKCDILRIGY